MKSFWTWLLPDTDDVLERGRAGMVIATCLGLVAAAVVLNLLWLFTGDLWIGTTIVGLGFSLTLVGIVVLARRGRTRLAAWLFVGLLVLIITLYASGFGLASPICTGYFIPTVLAACGLGIWAGLGVAMLCSAILWAMAWGASTGAIEPFIPFEISHLTFNAPTYTVFLFLVALIAGFWAHQASDAVRQYASGKG